MPCEHATSSRQVHHQSHNAHWPSIACSPLRVGSISSSQTQLILHTFFNLCIFIYAVIQLPQTRDALSGLGPNIRCGAYPRCTGDDSLFNVIYGPLVVVPIVIGIATLGFAVLIRKLYAEFGWAEFKLVGASLEMKRMSSPSPACIARARMEAIGLNGRIAASDEGSGKSHADGQRCTEHTRRWYPFSSCCSSLPRLSALQ